MFTTSENIAKCLGVYFLTHTVDQWHLVLGRLFSPYRRHIRHNVLVLLPGHANILYVLFYGVLWPNSSSPSSV